MVYKCCICGETNSGYGNNPQPVKPTGRCCGRCNDEFVIWARLVNIQNQKLKHSGREGTK